jgi:hypothetical protein
MEVFNSRNIVRVHCAIFTHIWSQLSGTNAMMYYIVYIFQVDFHPPIEMSVTY